MTDNEVFERVTVLWNAGDVRPYSDAERVEIEKMYTAVLGCQIRTCNCSEKWRDAVIEIYVYLKKNGTMHTTSQYILKAGVVIQPDGTSDVYTNANLTDAVAAEFLQKYPAAKGLFEKIPDNTSNGGNAAKSNENGQSADVSNAAAKSNENGQSADVSNAAVKSAIAAALESGTAKTKIKSDFAGREIDGVKLTQRLVAEYIKAIESEK